MAAEAVFNSPELLEMIASNLEPKEILRAQEVNSFFCATLRGSVKLNRLLWLVPRKHNPTAPTTKYNFNPLIANRHRRLGMESPLQWKIEKRDQPIGRHRPQGTWLCFAATDAYLVDIRFVSWAAVVAGMAGWGRGRRSCDDMIVMQPPQTAGGIVWSVGFYTPLVDGGPLFKEQRLKQVTFKYEDGRLPRLGDLKDVLVERFGVLGKRFDGLDEEGDGN